MRAGTLRHRIRLQEGVPVQNSLGEEVIDWQTRATVWANVQPIKGREYMEARATTQEISHRIRMRFQPHLDVHPSWRVLYGNRVFLVESVINTGERDRELVLMARENV